MSDIVRDAVAKLGERVQPGDLDFSVKLVIEGEGTVRIDESGVSADDSEADLTLIADADTFREIREQTLQPVAAVMSGRLRIEGNAGLAPRLRGIFG